MIKLDSEEAKSYAIKQIEAVDILANLEISIEKVKAGARRRTPTQNRCLHEYCSDMSIALNSSGYDMRAVISKFKDGFLVPWTEVTIKNLFRDIGMAMYGVKSTRDLSTVQIQKVYEVFDMRISEISGVTLPWPNWIDKQERKNDTN